MGVSRIIDVGKCSLQFYLESCFSFHGSHTLHFHSAWSMIEDSVFSPVKTFSHIRCRLLISTEKCAGDHIHNLSLWNNVRLRETRIEEKLDNIANDPLQSVNLSSKFSLKYWESIISSVGNLLLLILKCWLLTFVMHTSGRETH